MGRADMHIERQWFYFDDVSTRPSTITNVFTHNRVPTDDREKATGTAWVATARHPKDHHEYGVQAIHDDIVQDRISKIVRQELQRALDSYLADHPNGLDNPVVAV